MRKNPSSRTQGQQGIWVTTVNFPRLPLLPIYWPSSMGMMNSWMGCATCPGQIHIQADGFVVGLAKHYTTEALFVWMFHLMRDPFTHCLLKENSQKPFISLKSLPPATLSSALLPLFLYLGGAFMVTSFQVVNYMHLILMALLHSSFLELFSLA